MPILKAIGAAEVSGLARETTLDDRSLTFELVTDEWEQGMYSCALLYTHLEYSVSTFLHFIGQLQVSKSHRDLLEKSGSSIYRDLQLLQVCALRVFTICRSCLL